MPTTAFLGQFTQLKRGDGASPEVFTNIYETVSIGGFGQSNDLVEATHLLSTAKEFINGMADGVEFPVVVNYKPTDATHVGLMSDCINKVSNRNFKWVIPTSPSLTWSFAAIVRAWAVQNTTANEPFRVSFTLKVSGAITGPA